MNLVKATIIAGAGGALGTCMRYFCELLHPLGAGFPLGTFVANVVACFLIGIFYGWLNKSHRIGETGNLFLITGLCGGFSTLSSMGDELTDMIGRDAYGMFWLYMLASVILGLVAVAVGIACVKPSPKAPSTTEG